MRGLQVVFVLGAYYCAQGTQQPPLVNTKLGRLLGKIVRFSPRYLKQSGEVRVFLGIPYAKAPIGERRFREPEPVGRWEGDLNVTTLPSACLQDGLWLSPDDYRSSEDCLYLNVYVPSAAPSNASVMVYIHGGSLVVCSGHDFPRDPVPLAAIGEVIVVTMNYRLNIFGFFTTGDDVVPPHLGLRDQRLALQWVNENIEAFGPGKVTIFGESAGAATVGWHIVAAESRAFFQRAILQSGNPYAPWAKVPTMTLADIKQLGLGGCEPLTPENTTYIAECFRGKSVEELLNIPIEARRLMKRRGERYWSWGPVNNGGVFPTDIGSAIREGNYSGIDVMLGTNKDEGTYAASITYSYYRPFISKAQFFELMGKYGTLASDLLEVIYSASIDSTGNYEAALSSVIGDIDFTCGTNEFARQVATGGARVFMYRMMMVPVRSIHNAVWLGAAHGEELQFVFGLPFQDHPVYRPVYRELKFSYYLIQMWANFAKYGNPNVFPGIISEWPQFLPDTEIYKELDLDFTNKRKLRQHFCNFWDNLLPQIEELQKTPNN